MKDYSGRSSSELRTAGFTLLEVLIALIILAVGTVAVIQVQSSFLSAAREAELRSIAYAVAEAKLEELRNYQTKSEFFELTSSSSGSWDPVNVTYGAGTLTFTFDGSVVDAYDGSGATVAATSSDAKYKEVDIRVNLDDFGSIVLSTVVGVVDPALSGVPGIDESGGGGGEPDVSHIAGEVPNVIPIQISENTLRETSKPLPDVDTFKDSAEVRFETINYTSSGASDTKATKEDWLTINCFCELVANPVSAGVAPYHYKYNASSGELEVRSGVAVSVAYSGTPADGYDQSSYCDRCCEEHHDPIETVEGYPTYKQSVVSAAHSHYIFDEATGRTTTTVASAADNLYAEACRMRRVDGIYRLFPDWKLIDIKVFPYTLGESTAFASVEYPNLAIATVRDHIFGTSTAIGGFTSDTTINLVENGEPEQALARGLFVDDMSYDDDWWAFRNQILASSALLSDSNSWLSVVPFNEINMTLLADWNTDDANIASVTSSAITSITEEFIGLDYYSEANGYSRGEVAPVASGAAVVTAASKIDNTGLLGNYYKNSKTDNAIDFIDPDLTSWISSTVNVSVSGAGASTTVRLSGRIYTETYTKNFPGNNKYEYTTHNDSSVVVKANGTDCNYSYSAAVNYGSYSCVVDTNTEYTITVTQSTVSSRVESEFAVVPNNVHPAGEVSRNNGSITIAVGSGSVSDIEFNMKIDDDASTDAYKQANWTAI